MENFIRFIPDKEMQFMFSKLGMLLSYGVLDLGSEMPSTYSGSSPVSFSIMSKGKPRFYSLGKLSFITLKILENVGALKNPVSEALTLPRDLMER